uniref:Coiled-coil domain-containing protein 172 n=1 Tax=Seriola lalandi dorsalis TaxID=1841481 RepID=A0A3B4XDU0_SERLL
MSLDALFQQILLTEHQLTEQTQKFKDAQQSSVMRLQHDLIKKCEDQMLKKIEELLCQKRHLWERLVKRESKEEEEIFLQEISRFNSDFSLRGNRETVFESQTHTEILDLEREVESLYKLDRQLSVAEAMTASLRAESLFVSQKPLTDSTCLLRKELEMHKKAALELRQEELSSEIRLLQS